MSGVAETSPPCVVAVVVAFAPASERFSTVLAAVCSQVAAVIVVDNGEGAGLDGIGWSKELERIDMRGNAGVAAAQNAGARRAFERGASHVLLLDQDSVARPGMVRALLDAWTRLTMGGEQVAAVGANYSDPRRPGISPFVRIDGWRFRRVDNTDKAACPLLSYVISSGSLISKEAFRTIGPMKEAFFVDYIDIEWGLRASMLGRKTFGVCAAELEHVLGDTPLRIFGRSYPFRSPLRHYYMVRNGVSLVCSDALPVSWRFVEGWRLLRWAAAYALLAPNRRSHVRAMARGLSDGLKGRLGAAPRATAPAPLGTPVIPADG